MGRHHHFALLLGPALGLIALAIAGLLPAPSAGSTPMDRLSTSPPPRPPGGIRVSSSEDLLQQLAHAADGSILYLDAGTYRGPITIDRGIVLWGPREAIIESPGVGTTVQLTGTGSAALGFTISGSGTRFDLLDAGLEIQGEDLRAEGLLIVEAVYGILANQSKRIHLVNNQVIGTGQPALGLRGDGIRIWETYDSVIQGNRMTKARDLVIWYSSRNQIVDNHVTGCRYGTHLMYSHDNQVFNNVYQGNVVGLFSMYSRDLRIVGNTFAESDGSAGIGLGMKESSSLHIADNLFIGNQRGIYFDNSPFEPGTQIEVLDNDFRFSSVALNFHDPPHDVVLRRNQFRDNWSLLSVAGGGTATGIEVEGNDFDTYRGYDLDHDGIGDLPFEERSVSEQLVAEHESLALFRGTPASAMLQAVGELLPLYRPKALLVDPHPAFGLPPRNQP